MQFDFYRFCSQLTGPFFLISLFNRLKDCNFDQIKEVRNDVRHIIKHTGTQHDYVHYNYILLGIASSFCVQYNIKYIKLLYEHD